MPSRASSRNVRHEEPIGTLLEVPVGAIFCGRKATLIEIRQLGLLALAILISATQSVAAAPRDRRDAGQSGQNSAGTYKGYPLSQWYRTDGW